jgi:hypothetical protein
MYPVRSYRQVPEDLFPKFDKYADPPGYEKIKPKLFNYTDQTVPQQGGFYKPTQNLSPNPNLQPPTYRVNSPGIQISPNMHFNLNVTNIVQKFDNPFEEEEHSSDLPYFPEEILKLMHNFGYALLKDDAHDIGFLKYINRRGYPNHPSSLHHYPVGIALMTIAQLGGMVSKMKEFMEVGADFAGMGEDFQGLTEMLEDSPSPKQPRLPPIRVYGTPALEQTSGYNNGKGILPERRSTSRSVQPALPAPTQSRISIPSAPKLPV